MSKLKSIEPTTANISELQDSLKEVDMLVQGAAEKIAATSKSICLMLREPDSGVMRLRIKTLCEIIEYQAFDAMNTVNCIAERHGADFIDEHDLVEARRLHAAARGVFAHV